MCRRFKCTTDIISGKNRTRTQAPYRREGCTKIGGAIGASRSPAYLGLRECYLTGTRAELQALSVASPADAAWRVTVRPMSGSLPLVMVTS